MESQAVFVTIRQGSRCQVCHRRGTLCEVSRTAPTRYRCPNPQKSNILVPIGESDEEGWQVYRLAATGDLSSAPKESGNAAR